MNILSINILELDDNAQKIIMTSSAAALEILFEGCDTVEKINRTADQLVAELF